MEEEWTNTIANYLGNKEAIKIIERQQLLVEQQQLFVKLELDVLRYEKKFNYFIDVM